MEGGSDGLGCPSSSDHNDHAAKVNRTGIDLVLPLTDDTSATQIRASNDWCQASLIP